MHEIQYHNQKGEWKTRARLLNKTDAIDYAKHIAKLAETSNTIDLVRIIHPNGTMILERAIFTGKKPKQNFWSDLKELIYQETGEKVSIKELKKMNLVAHGYGNRELNLTTDSWGMAGHSISDNGQVFTSIDELLRFNKHLAKRCGK